MKGFVNVFGIGLLLIAGVGLMPGVSDFIAGSVAGGATVATAWAYEAFIVRGKKENAG